MCSSRRLQLNQYLCRWTNCPAPYHKERDFCWNSGRPLSVDCLCSMEHKILVVIWCRHHVIWRRYRTSYPINCIFCWNHMFVRSIPSIQLHTSASKIDISVNTEHCSSPILALDQNHKKIGIVSLLKTRQFRLARVKCHVKIRTYFRKNLQLCFT